jgi:hypothetical protein
MKTNSVKAGGRQSKEWALKGLRVEDISPDLNGSQTISATY